MKKILFTLAVLLSGTMLHADDVKYLSRKELEQCNIILTYPQWKLKALSFSYDDGNIADRKLIEIFNRFGMHGTFHIPSAWLTDPKRSVSRVKEAEIKTLYSGHEVSGHGAKHVTLTLVKPARIAGELDGDITTWQRITGKKLIGYACFITCLNFSDWFWANIIRFAKNDGFIGTLSAIVVFFPIHCPNTTAKCFDFIAVTFANFV